MRISFPEEIFQVLPVGPAGWVFDSQPNEPKPSRGGKWVQPAVLGHPPNLRRARQRWSSPLNSAEVWGPHRTVVDSWGGRVEMDWRMVGTRHPERVPCCRVVSTFTMSSDKLHDSWRCISCWVSGIARSLSWREGDRCVKLWQ